MNLNETPSLTKAIPLRPRLRSAASQLIYPTIRRAGELIKRAARKVVRRPANKAGFVYIIWHKAQYAAEGVVKIGMTSNLKSRIGAGNTWSFGGSFEYVLFLPVSNMRDAEATLHRIFDASRQHGEWFKIDVGTAKMNLQLIADEFPLNADTHTVETADE